MRELTVIAEKNDGLFLCQEFISGGNDDTQFEVATSIGLGGADLILRGTYRGKKFDQEVINLKDMVQEWVAGICNHIDLMESGI